MACSFVEVPKITHTHIVSSDIGSWFNSRSRTTFIVIGATRTTVKLKTDCWTRQQQ